jgi:pimeloyl-ACP methyl ester carboxylesterase
MPIITTSTDTQLYVKQWGTGRPVILLHGWPLSSDMWDHHAMKLAEAGYCAIAYDRRGFGRSSQPWSGYDYDTLADDLASVIEQTGARDAMLVGFSMGGGEVARYMSRHAGKGVSQAVLVSSVVPYMLVTPDNVDGTAPEVFDKLTAALTHDRAKFYGHFFKDFYGFKILHTVSSEVLEWTRSVAMQASLPATLACVKSFSTTDFRPDLASFKVPTLIIHGNDDQIVPIYAAGRAAAKRIANSTLIEYDGAPHAIPVTHRDRLMLDLLEFARSR